jgi:multiple sugar transport system permease protein
MKKNPYLKRRRNFYVMMFVLPVVLLTLLFLFIPMFSVFYYSFFEYNMMLSKEINFNGIANYIRLLSNDPIFYKALNISFRWVAMNLVFQMGFGMMIALLITRNFNGRGLIRTLIISPYAVSGVLASTLWLFMFQDNFGLINDVLKKLGVINQNIAWTSSVRWALFAAVISETWRYTPFFVIIFSAALQSISKDYYEAAKIDGANALRRFTSITIPFLKETVTFSCILRVVWEFNNVDVIYTLTKGGPMNETTTLAMYLVKTAIQGSDMGYGSALTVVSFILLAVFSLLLIKIGGVSKESVI